ncbi:hypothetical protein ACIBSV_37575 [Embleya sp. NPDC050154]|uniref:hypothetical protein n=1 Tax=Embleya sp. NPDC050154 TaxID=3363988 RepID=UPI0037975790
MSDRSPSAKQPSTTLAVVPVAACLDVRPTAASEITRLTTGEVGKRRFASPDPRRWNSRTGLAGGIANYKVFAASAASLTAAGSVLMVLGTKRQARDTALAIADHLDVRPEATVLSEYLAQTLGSEHHATARWQPDTTHSPSAMRQPCRSRPSMSGYDNPQRETLRHDR